MTLNALLAVLGLAAVLVTAAPESVSLLAVEPLGDGLTGWERRGDAEFALDAGVSREGRPSARIRVAAGTPPAYQQLARGFEGVRPGDELEAVAWARSEGLDQDPGAYLALEFLDARGERVGIAHSATGRAQTGAAQWARLRASGIAPGGTRAARLSLILHAHGTAWFVDPTLTRTGRQEEWPDLGSSRRSIVVRADEPIRTGFGGVGFHAFHHTFPATPAEMDEVIYKRWRELRPSFARLNNNWDWDHAKLDQVAEHILRMKQAGTQVYLTTWNPPDVKSDEELSHWATKVADDLDYLIRKKGCTNVRYYCMTNELSLTEWGSLVHDLPRFKRYHSALYQELKKRRIPVGLLATDASPIDLWGTIEWATQNMDEVTAIYGGHHYINDWAPEDERFYPWFHSKLEWATGLARGKGKDFILGEFGAKQDGRTLNGVKMDVCVYYGTPQEPVVGLQLADAALAALNAGVYALGYWTFMDLPDDFAPGYLNKWGLTKCSGTDRGTRDPYYAYGLLTHFLRGPSDVLPVECADPRLRAAAVRPKGSQRWSLALLNRNQGMTPIDLTLSGLPASARVRRYTYDARQVPQNRFGDLQGPSGNLPLSDGHIQDTLSPNTLTVYTTDFDSQPPRAVLEPRAKGEAGATSLSWKPNPEADLCYYRVYAGETRDFLPSPETQVGSTIATHLSLANTGKPRWIRVLAVDSSGNAGPASEPIQAEGLRG
ncbi:MAG TPA: hypothetical protein VGN26_21970 [Armatimonadota bacterium]|jgi:hypothetical protein